MLFPFFPRAKKHQKEIINNSQNTKCIKILKESLKNKENDYCFECGVGHPQYISINNGIFLCKECILNHLQLSQEASTIIKNDLKILTLNEIEYIYNGGNQKLFDFINEEFPKLKKMEPNLFYNTKAMDYYRKKLKYLAEGGEEPIKPIGDDAYISISKKDEDEINDIEIEGNELYDENIYKNNKNENDNNNIHRSNLNPKQKTKNKEELVNIPKKIYEENTYKTINKSCNLNFTDNKRNKLKINIDDENDNNNTISNINHINKSNFNYYNNCIKNNQLSKNIKFKKNFNNFDNENYNYSTNKTSDTIDIFNSNYKDISNGVLKKGILSPYPTSNNICNFTEKFPDNKIKNVLYSKPKGIAFFKNYKFRTKSDYSKIDSNNKINIVLNINEFNIDNKKQNLNNSRNGKRKNNNSNNEYNNFTEKIKNTKINDYSYSYKNNKTENKNKNEIYLDKKENKTISENNNKNKSTYFINRYKSKNKTINEKEEKQNDKEKNENKENQNISLNISQFKIIKNINNYNINIDQIKNEKINYKIEKFNCLNKFPTENSIYQSQKIISNIEKEQTQNKEIKIEKSIENKKRNYKKLIDTNKNKINIENNNIFKSIPRNPIKNYQTFTRNRTINNEINLKYNHKFIERKDSSSKDKNFSFNNLNEKCINKEKEIQSKEKKENIKSKELNDKINNKSMDETYNGFIKESIRNKYKKKKKLH